MQHLNRRLLLGGLTTAALAVPSSALAAPVSVDLRIEGPTSTLFEGPVTTDVRLFRFTEGADTGDHVCDGTSATGGPSPSPVPTRGAALMAAVDRGLRMSGSFGSFGASFSTINGTSVAYDPATYDYLVEFENFKAAGLGACSDDIKPGDQVLFGYGGYGAPALKLTGPTRLAPGAVGSATVVDGDTGAPVAGATVGGATTAANGTAPVGPFSDRGPHALKAQKTGTIRSNRLDVCVTDGADGFCGTTAPGAPPAPVPSGPAPAPSQPCLTTGDDGLCGTRDTRPPGGSIRSVQEQQRFAKGKGPRELSGRATDPQGVRQVTLRLTRRIGKRCYTFSGSRERFVGARCGASNGTWFKAAETGDWSYLLPTRAGKGRFVLDVRGTDTAGNVDRKLDRGRNRIVFHVAG